MTTPYIGFSNSTLRDLPRVEAGDEVHCPHCNGRHSLECGKDDAGRDSNLLMFYRCGDKTYLAAVDGKLVAHVRADCRGKI